jgi:hypothetical protein
MIRLGSTLLKIAGTACAVAAFNAPALAQDSGYDRRGYDQNDRYE